MSAISACYRPPLRLQIGGHLGSQLGSPVQPHRPSALTPVDDAADLTHKVLIVAQARGWPRADALSAALRPSDSRFSPTFVPNSISAPDITSMVGSACRESSLIRADHAQPAVEQPRVTATQVLETSASGVNEYYVTTYIGPRSWRLPPDVHAALLVQEIAEAAGAHVRTQCRARTILLKPAPQHLRLLIIGSVD